MAEKQGGFEKTTKQDSKYRRAAKFLILIGAEKAQKVLSSLEPEQVEAVSREIASIGDISPEEAREVIAEFEGLLTSPYSGGGRERGGVEEARALLYAAFGPEKGEKLLNKAVPESAARVFGFLDTFPGEQVAFLLKDESPATAALVLSRLSPSLSAKTLASASLDGQWKLETVRRIARAGEVAPEILTRVSEALQEKARKSGGPEAPASKPDGVGVLAEILKAGDIDFGERILSGLADEDSDLSETLKERLYTLQDVVSADSRVVAMKLQDMSGREIAVLIKDRPAAFVEKILSCVSSGRREAVSEELACLGPVPRKEYAETLKGFMTWFRAEIEGGAIVLGSRRF